MITFSRHSIVYVVAVFSLLLGAVRPLDLFVGGAVAQTTSDARPFEMLVLGDSVVWGQGLSEKNKFYTRVKNEIESELGGGRKVRQLVEAHSGAVIAPKKPKSCPTAPGEVPMGTPTLFSQVDTALSKYAAFGVNANDVDLVLLNGCINDVGFPVIVNPFTSEKTITKQSEKFCKKGMEKLLPHIRTSFPRAVIVVTGFFPIISEATDPDVISKLLEAFFGGSQSKKIVNKAEKEQQKELRRVSSGKQNAEQVAWVIRRLARLSDHWKTVSDGDLQAAVNTVNSVTPPVYFVAVDFRPKECYAAAETSLWKITGSGGGIGNLITDDEMFVQRQETCRVAAANVKGVERLTCSAAGTGHPNVKGAEKYANAIMQQLRKASVLVRR